MGVALQDLEAPVMKDTNSLVCLTDWEHKPGVLNSENSGHIKYSAVHIGGHAARGDLPAGNGLNNLLLRSQGVTGAILPGRKSLNPPERWIR